MDPNDEARIRQRAYEIWLDEGAPAGRSDANWLQAEQELSSPAMDPAWTQDAPTDAPVADTPPKRRKARA